MDTTTPTMPTVQIVPGPKLVPRHVQRLNAYAVANGIDVEMAVAPYDNDPLIRLWSNWRTTRERFLSLDILTPGNHLPCEFGFFTVPMGIRLERHRALLTGDVTVTGSSVLWEIDSGPAEFEIQQVGEVEIVTYEDEILYHGTAAALIASGIDRRRLPLGKKPSKSAENKWLDTNPRWKARRQLDGAIVYRVESAKALRDRCLEIDQWHRQRAIAGGAPDTVAPRPRPFLRLVVDNDPGPHRGRQA